MSKIEEIEQLPLQEFTKLADWVVLRRQRLEAADTESPKDLLKVRDHSAFLTSYAPQGEGLYDDAAAR